jgi:acyl carrier protein
MQATERLNRIAAFFEERGYQVKDQTDLFESGAIDSMGIIELVVFIEEELGIQLDASNMTADSFRTLQAISIVIERANA